MVTTTSRHSWLNAISLLLVFPAAYVIFISVLKYGLGIHDPFDASSPLLERMGIKESLGWNINLLILLSPVTAILLCAIQIIHIEWQITKEQFRFIITIHRKWVPISIAFFSGLVLATLFVYMLGENCNCH